MTKLMPVFIFGLIMAFISDKYSIVGFNQNGKKVYKKKEILFFLIGAIVIAVFVGLRTTYNDTYTYRNMYENLDAGFGNIASLSFSLGDNPGFWVTNTILKTLGFSTQTFLMFYALITVGIYLWFIRKYSDSIWFSIFLFFTMGCYTFTMAAIKQCVAVAFCLIGIDRFLQNKKHYFIFWIFVASTFHPYSLMYLIAPFLTFDAWSSKTRRLLIIFGVIAIGIQPLLGSIINITTMLGEEYDVSTFMGEGINIFRLAVVWAPIIVSFITRKYLRRNNSKVDNIILNLSMLNAEIMFIGLFGTANYFGRLANYFLMFQPLLLPHILKAFNKSSKQRMTIICMVCYFLYFYYTNAINQSFDGMYRYVSFFEYLRS